MNTMRPKWKAHVPKLVYVNEANAIKETGSFIPPEIFLNRRERFGFSSFQTKPPSIPNQPVDDSLGLALRSRRQRGGQWLRIVVEIVAFSRRRA